jgi:hypothetical protein
MEAETEEGEKSLTLHRWDPYYIRSLTRFSDAGLIPPLSVSRFPPSLTLPPDVIPIPHYPP